MLLRFIGPKYTDLLNSSLPSTSVLFNTAPVHSVKFPQNTVFSTLLKLTVEFSTLLFVMTESMTVLGSTRLFFSIIEDVMLLSITHESEMVQLNLCERSLLRVDLIITAPVTLQLFNVLFVTLLLLTNEPFRMAELLTSESCTSTPPVPILTVFDSLIAPPLAPPLSLLLTLSML